MRRALLKTCITLLVAGGCLSITALVSSQGAPPTKTVCGHAHTPPGSEKAIAGQHIHQKTNPRGQTYVFGTYSAAHKVHVVTKPTTVHTWFEGYGWSVLVCAESGQHVGWRFAGGGGAFYAILLTKTPVAGS